MQRNIPFIQGINIVFWGITVVLLLCILILPFLEFDRQYNITGNISFRAISLLTDSSLRAALMNSVLLSLISSLFAVLCGSVVTSALKKRSVLLLGGLLAVYSINPVARALSYFTLFQVYTPIYRISEQIFGARFSMTILLPALILSMHYLPIYLMRSLFILKQKEAEGTQYNAWHRMLFLSIPPWVKGFPISFALFFLLTFFDYWVIQVISGNTVLYWTPLFIQKALQSRAINEAALMIGAGLIITVGAYLVAVAASFLVRMFLRTLRPLSFTRIPSLPNLGKIFQHSISIGISIFLLWPLMNMILRLIPLILSGKSIPLTPGAIRAIILMALLGIAVGILSTGIGLFLSAVFQTSPGRYRWWLPALYVLALVPEAAYVLWSLLMTGSGLLHGNPWWLLFLMLSFSIPISFFLWESLWGEVEQLKLWLLGAAMKNSLTGNMKLALAEWKKSAGIIFLVILWMTIDNVFITDFAAGPKWKTLSAVIFDATKRGFSDSEFITSVVSAACVFGFFVIVLAIGHYAKKTREKTND